MSINMKNNNIKMDIFNNNLKKNPKTILLRKKKCDIGMTKYLPSFSKEWKNTVYSYNKNTLKNIPMNDLNINKIIKGYFNLYFKDNKFTNSKFILLKRRRNLLRRIHVSNAEIKHTNNKAIITLYTINREKNVLKKKYLKINKKISKRLIAKRYFLLYKKNIHKIYNVLNKHMLNTTASMESSNNTPKDRIFINDIIRKKNFIKYKLEYLNKFIKLKDLYLKKVWGIILNKYARKYLRLLRKYDLLYSLNQYKFNKLIFLPILSNILNKIIGKKIEYNIINLKSIANNTDLFTNALALKLKKRRINYIKNMFSILNRAYLPNVNTFKERSRINNNIISITAQEKELKIISNIGVRNLYSSCAVYSDEVSSNLSKLLDNRANVNNKEIPNKIYDSIGYKHMAGIRIEVKGRLTKRYRADRSVYSLKWKGGLKNIDSSFKRESVPLYRGNQNPNVAYTLVTSKRRIGAFAVKGWISGKTYSTMARVNARNSSIINPWAVTGFTDAEGSFIINVNKDKRQATGWKLQLRYRIGLHNRDNILLDQIKDHFGVGSVYPNSRYVEFCIQSMKDLGAVINHFDQFPLLTKKYGDYQLFKQAYNIVKNKDHLSLEGLKRIIAIKASLNLGLSDELKLAFPDIVPEVKPNIPIPISTIVENKTLDPNWLAGFVSGEGCFYITIFNSPTTKSGVQVQLGFNLTQDIRDEDLMNCLSSYLDCGRLKKTSKNKSSCIDLVVTKFSDLNTKIIPLFNQHKLLGVKALDFDNWCSAAILFSNKEHLTTEGLDKIRAIQTQMRD
uniref:Homing endonuclease LAGLIDADG domain-containing protein n=1 Tax=Calonectria ilicicola TaxID=182845 RepID=A0A6G7MXT2_9HYPO|nr:hypothetical protein [Calonectria ilicicola]